MSQAELNTYANQVKATWMKENEVIRRPSSPGTALLRTLLRQRREQQRQMQKTISSALDMSATAS